MGVTGALRPVFDFLSGNTIALAAALTLLGKSVLTAILPNFKDMGEASSAAMKKANMGVLEHQAHLENVQRKLKATTASMIAQRDVATANAQAAFGKTVPQTTRGGGGALDFLMGSSDTKKAQAQADKALKTAESQLKLSLTKRTGMFKHMNAEQLAIMRASYAQRSLLIKQEEAVHKGATVGMIGHIKVLGAQTALTFAGMKVALVGFGATAAAVGMTLMTWLGWLGILALVGSALVMLYEKLFPIPEKIKDAQDASERFVESAKVLNKELLNMANITDRVNLGLGKLATQRGNMASQANFEQRLNDLRATEKLLTRESTQYKLQIVELMKTASVLSNSVSPAFRVYIGLLSKNRSLTKKQEAGLLQLTDKFAGWGVAVEKLPEKLQVVKRELTDLLGAAKDVDPLMALSLAVTNAAEGSQAALDGMKYRIDAETASVDRLTKSLQKQLSVQKTIAQKETAAGSKKNKGSTGFLGGYTTNETVALANPNKTVANPAFIGASGEDITNLLKDREGLELLQKEYDLAANANTKLQALQKGLIEDGVKVRKNHTEALKLREEEVSLARRGLTISDRMFNKGLEINSLQADLLDAKNRQIIATRVYDTMTGKELLTTQTNNLEAKNRADSDIIKLNKKLEIKRMIIREDINNLVIDRESLSIAEESLKIQIKAGILARGLASLNAGINTFGFEKAKLVSRQKVLILENKIQQAVQKAAAASQKLAKGGQTEEELAKNKAAQQSALDALDMAKEKLRIAKNAGIIQQNELRAEGEITKFKSTNFAWTKQQEAVQKEVLKALQKGIDITPEWLETTKEIVAENAKLTRQYEMQSTIKSSMTSGMAQGIAALLKNEEGSFKDSMLVLAEGVLGSIADKLAEQMADDIMGMLFQEETTAQTINAAMLTGASATGTAITTATGVGATTIGTAITTACTIGAATLGAAAAAGSAAGSVVDAVAGVMSDSDRESGMHDVIASLTKEKEQREASPMALPTAGLNPAGLLSGLQGKLGGDGEPATEDTQRKILASLGGEGSGGEGFFGRIKNTFMGLFAGIRGLFKSKGKEDEKKEKGFFKNLWDMFTNLGTWIAALFKSKEGSEGGDEGGNPLSKLTDIFSKKEGADAEGDKNFFAKMGDMIGSMFSKGGDTGGGGAGGGGDGGKANVFVKAFSWIMGLFGGGGAPPAAKNGGVISMGQKVPGYATGGVARGPGAGYPALLHGTEAVVPLPNGKSIPVDMPQNAGQQNNSVVVNISQDGSADTSDSSGPDMQRLGGAIAKAVQKELQAQKRSGGILSPYGVA